MSQAVAAEMCCHAKRQNQRAEVGQVNLDVLLLSLSSNGRRACHCMFAAMAMKLASH